MKVLLDENLPKELKAELKGHNVSTVEDQGWRSIKNGNLLSLMKSAGFEVFIMCDRQLSFQQNLKKHLLPVVVLRAKNLNHDLLLQFAPLIIKLLKGRLKPGPHELTLN